MKITGGSIPREVKMINRHLIICILLPRNYKNKNKKLKNFIKKLLTSALACDILNHAASEKPLAT